MNYLACNVVRKPVQTLVKTLSRSCTSALNIPEINQVIALKMDVHTCTSLGD